MPPEPSPWDRKDSFREKRYDKPDTRERRDFVVEEAGAFGKLQPAVSEISSNRRVQVSWPYVPYRQGRERVFFEDTAHGFMPGQSTDFLVQEKMYEDENPNFRLEGRYHKASREHMGANQGPGYHQRGQRLQNWDNGGTALLCTGRHDMLSGKSVDHTSLHFSHPHSDSESSWDQVQSKEKGGKTGLEHSTISYKIDAHKRTPDIDFGRFTEKDFETRLDRYGSTSSTDSPIGVSQNHPRDHLMSSIDWKPLKWVRSGNSSPWSSLFGQAGSFKESRAELQTSLDILGKTSPQHSPSRLTSDGVCFVPDEESHPRKKQRLGWGQGLAKYEKQKVGGAEDDNNKINLFECSISASPKVEEVGHALGENLEARSPKAAASSGCGSPATPYSVTYFSSPDEHASSSGAGFNEVGLYEKDSVKIPDAVCHGDHFPHGNPLAHASLRAIGSCSIVAESSLESEHLDVNPFTHVNSLTVDNLRTEDASLGGSSSRRPDAIGKLLLVKNDILQKLERTEHDIDMCEKELRSLNFETKVEDCHSLGTSCSYANKDCVLEPCTKVGEKDFGDRCSEALDRGIQVPATVRLLNDGFVVPSSVSEAAEVCVSYPPSEKQCIECQVEKIEANAAVIQSVGSQWPEDQPLEKRFMGCQGARTEHTTADKQDVRFQSSQELKSDDVKYVSMKADSEVLETQLILATEQKSAACIDLNAEVAVQSCCMIESADNVFSILSANKELAKEASELFINLLPTVLPRASGTAFPDMQDSYMGKHNGMTDERYKKRMEEKIVDQKHSLIFKEQVLAIKFRALRHLWKEDQLLPSSRKYRARAQKRWESNFRLNGGHQKYRSSIRSRFASSGKLTLVPTKEVVQLASKLLSDGHIRPYRSILKMPALALDDKERLVLRFISRNGLVEDPIAFEKERTMINPWTPEEREIFTEKFATFGKNFSKIASFIEHKTTADCVEFYYKNQKSEDLEKIKKRHQLQNQTRPSTFLASSGNNRHRESNAVSLDVLGAASVVAAYSSDQATGIHGTLQKYSGRPTLGMCFDPGRLRNEGFMTSNKRIFAGHILDSERECTAAADVLAGIFGAFSSEALSSCITSAVDPSEGLPEKSCAGPYQKKSAVVGQPLTSEVMQNIEVQYSSEESCEEVNLDWTDDEKGLFITAVSMFGKDFQNISRYVRSRNEDQCKTFFSKARKRLGLDELIQRELTMPAERGPGSDDDDSGLIETCTGLGNVDSSSAKMAETPESNVLSAAQQNGRSEVVLDEDGDGYLRNDDDKNSLNKQIELMSGSVEAMQNDVEVIPGEACVSPEVQLSPRGRGLQVGVLAEMQQDENESKVLDSVFANMPCSTEHIEGPNRTESCNSARSFDGNSGEGNERKSCEPLNHSHVSKLPVDDIESLETFQTDGNVKKNFVNSKSELKKNVQDVGSLREMLSLKEVKCLPASMEKGKCSVVSVTSECCKSVGIESMPTLGPHQKSSYHCSSLKSGIMTSNNTLKAASNGRAMTVHVSDDTMSRGKCFVGSGRIYLEGDHFGKNSGVMPTENGESMGGTHELSVQDSILEENGSISTSKEVAWKMYSDHKALGAFPAYGQDKTPMCTSTVFQFQQQHSNVFSHSLEQKVHYMQPEVVLWQQKQKESSLVPQKDQSMLKQVSVSSALIRNQQLDNPAFHNYSRQNGSHQIQQEVRRSMPRPIMCQGSSDSEQSSQQFGGHQLQVRGENHRHTNADTCQKEMHQQSVSDSEQSSRIIGGYPVQVFNQEEVCMPANVDTYQQATLQQVAQGSYNSCMKNLRQRQITQQNPQQEILQKLHTAASQGHKNLVTQFFQKPNSEQAIELSNQRDRSLQFPEQYHLYPWQQKRKVHNVSCEDHMFLQKTGWKEEHQEHLKHQSSDIKFNPAVKSAYSCQSHVAHLQPPCLATQVKPCPESEAQTLRTGDVKLFGQILLSHPSNQVRLEAPLSTTSIQSGCKIFNGQENEWSFASASPEQQPGRAYPGLHSECVEVSVKESDSCSVQEAIAQVTERLASETCDSKCNLAKITAAYSGQEFPVKKFGCWEVKGGRNMSVQTVASPQSRDVKYLQVKPLHDSLPDMGLIDQPAMTGNCKEMAKDSTMIAGGQSRLTHDCRLPGSREPEGDSFFSLDLKQQDFFIELQKRGAIDIADSHESVRTGTTYGRCGRLQPPMFGFQPQFRSISGHTGFHRGVLPGGIVSDPVTAIRMQCPAGEHVAVAIEHPQVTSIRGPELGRGDYGR